MKRSLIFAFTVRYRKICGLLKRNVSASYCQSYLYFWCYHFT